MIFRLCFLTLAFIYSIAFSYVSHAGPREVDKVVDLYKKLLVGRSLLSEEGTLQTFVKHTESDGEVSFVVETEFANYSSIQTTEVIRQVGARVLMTQMVDGIVARDYVLSIDGPYGVLRSRPLQPEKTDYISRDCVDRKNKTFCYVKVRYRDDVVVSTFEEVAHSN